MENKDIIFAVSEVSAFVSSLIFLIKANDNLKKQRSLLQYLEQAKIFQCSELYEILQKNLIKKASKEFLKFSDNGLSSDFYAFIKGVVDTKNPKQGLINKQQQLIMSQKIVEPIFSNSQYIYPKEKQIVRQNKKRFFINQESNKSKSILVIPVEKTNFTNSMAFLNSSTQISNYFKILKFLIVFIDFLKIILTPLRLNRYLRGFKLGYRSTEYGVKLGDKILAYGKFLFDHQTNLITMIGPLYLLNNKKQILDDQQEEIRKWIKIKLMSIILVSISGLLVFKRLIILLKRSFYKFKIFWKLPRKVWFQTINQFYCISCGQEPKSVILKPCFHWTFCKQCANGQQIQRCPVCNKKVTSRFDVFVVQLTFLYSNNKCYYINQSR